MSSSFVTTQQNLSPHLELNWEEEEVADDVVTRVMGMPEILSKILGYMDYLSLYKTRLVNHLWKAESKIYFKQRSEIDLIKIYRKFGKVKLEQFLEICKSHQNFRLRLFSPYHEEMLNYENREIINFVVSSPAPLIKFLHLYLSVHDSQDFILKISILSNLSHLKELELKVDVRECWEKLDLNNELQVVPQLPLVTKLEMQLDFGRDLKESDEPKVQKLCQKLLFMTPNLEELTLTPRKQWPPMNQRFVLAYLEQLVRLQREWKDSKSNGHMPFQNLSIINGLQLYELNVSEKILMSCLEFLQPFKGLAIDYYPETDNAFTLQKILHKNSKTLETLGINTFWSDGHLNIALPVFPKLGRLSLGYRDVFNLRELLLMGAEEFNSKFPKLYSLKLRDPKEFLPIPNCQTDLSFPQFTSLEMHVYDIDKFGDIVYDERWVKWLPKLFPNVYNPLYSLSF